MTKKFIYQLKKVILMNKKEFNLTLKQTGLSQKKFADILGIASQTVNSWGTTQNIPYWVESWLDNYAKAKLADEVINAVAPFVKK